jgi:hypothetical protein
MEDDDSRQGAKAPSFVGIEIRSGSVPNFDWRTRTSVHRSSRCHGASTSSASLREFFFCFSRSTVSGLRKIG